MNWDFMFFFNSILLGVGLAMDAFTISLANGLNEPKMGKARMCGIAGVFSLFQFATPMIGWCCVCKIAQCFKAFEKCIPLIALLLLCYIGGKMLYEGINNKDSEEEKPAVGFMALLIQGIATSIDALSVGFTISNYAGFHAFVACLVIAIVTFAICMVGLFLGKKFGTHLAGKAGILGGCILIFIGLEIFIKSLL